jgi:hypothetical protein
MTIAKAKRRRKITNDEAITAARTAGSFLGEPNATGGPTYAEARRGLNTMQAFIRQIAKERGVPYR